MSGNVFVSPSFLDGVFGAHGAVTAAVSQHVKGVAPLSVASDAAPGDRFLVSL